MPESYASLPAYIDAAVAGLKARSGLADKQVVDSWPGEEQKPESIWFDEASSSDEVAGMRAGTARMNEVFSVFVYCDVLAHGKDAKTARDALAVLMGEVLAWVAATKRVDVASIVSHRVAGWKYRQYMSKEGRGVAVRIEIRVTGRR